MCLALLQNMAQDLNIIKQCHKGQRTTQNVRARTERSASEEQL